MNNRLVSLDGLRGAAALIVVFYHLSLAKDHLYYIAERSLLLRPLVAGQASVYVFFVLSGFVLFLTFEKRDGRRLAPYAAKRIIRLYPPLVAGVLLAACFYAIAQPEPLPGLSPWFNNLSWTFPLSAELVAGHLLLFDPDKYHSLNNVIWSLVHEIRISLIFPVLALFLRRFPKTTLLATILGSEICHRIIAGRAATMAIDPIYTLQYLSLFSIGGFIYMNAAQIRGWMENKTYWPMLIFAVILLSLPIYHNILISIGASLIVILALCNTKFEKFLSSRCFVWLGKVSFSLYLIHVPLILLALHLLNDRLPLPLILPAIFLTSLALAEIFHRIVEQPSIRAARWAGHSLANSPFFARHR